MLSRKRFLDICYSIKYEEVNIEFDDDADIAGTPYHTILAPTLFPIGTKTRYIHFKKLTGWDSLDFEQVPPLQHPLVLLTDHYCPNAVEVEIAKDIAREQWKNLVKLLTHDSLKETSTTPAIQWNIRYFHAIKTAIRRSPESYISCLFHFGNSLLNLYLDIDILYGHGLIQQFTHLRRLELDAARLPSINNICSCSTILQYTPSTPRELVLRGIPNTTLTPDDYKNARLNGEKKIVHLELRGYLPIQDLQFMYIMESFPNLNYFYLLGNSPLTFNWSDQTQKYRQQFINNLSITCSILKAPMCILMDSLEKHG